MHSIEVVKTYTQNTGTVDLQIEKIHGQSKSQEWTKNFNSATRNASAAGPTWASTVALIYIYMYIY